MSRQQTADSRQPGEEKKASPKDDQQVAVALCDALLDDLSDRSGIGDVIGQLDDEVMGELQAEWRSIIRKQLGAEPEAEEEETGAVLGPLSGHEVLDRSFLVTETFSRFVADHPFVKSVPELRAAAEKLGEELAAFYQLAGKHSFEREDPPATPEAF